MKVQVIQNKIYEIRSQKVMFDFDLAELYDVERRALNQAVKRNISRFPGDFMFQLTKKEWEPLKSQMVISSWGGSRSLPYAFTEHGITMLASLLKSQKAIKMNIAIVRAFIAMRKFALEYKGLVRQMLDLRQKVGEHDGQLMQIYDTIEKMLENQAGNKNWEDRERIGFKKN